MTRIYLDNAATTPLDPVVIEAMLPYMQTHFGNPSAIHFYGRETRAAIENARKTIAKFLNCSPGEIFFTSGGTEANNTAIRRTVETLGLKKIISSPIEHHCGLHTCEELAKEGKCSVEYVKVDSLGRFDLNSLEELLKNAGTRCLVSLMHANNEIGTKNNLVAIGELCKKYDAIFHTDTVQTMAHYKFDLKTMPVHLLSGAAHKFHGPKGVGFLYINSTLKINPLIYGGAQERNMRAGTENVYGIVGLAKAMEKSFATLEETTAHISALKKYMMSELKNNFSGIKFNGDMEGDSLYTVLNVGFPMNSKNELLLMNLDINGICASSGSACSSGSDKSSHVLECIGAANDRVSIRFSFSKFNTMEEVDFVIAKLKELVGEKVTV